MIEAKLRDSLNEIRGLIARALAGETEYSWTETIIKVNKAHCRLKVKCDRELTSRTDVNGAMGAQLSAYRLHRSKVIFCASKN